MAETEIEKKRKYSTWLEEAESMFSIYGNSSAPDCPRHTKIMCTIGCYTSSVVNCCLIIGSN